MWWQGGVHGGRGACVAGWACMVGGMHGGGEAMCGGRGGMHGGGWTCMVVVGVCVVAGGMCEDVMSYHKIN